VTFSECCRLVWIIKKLQILKPLRDPLDQPFLCSYLASFRGGTITKFKGIAVSLAPALGLMLSPSIFPGHAHAQTIDGGATETVNGGGGGTQPSPWVIGGNLTVGEASIGTLSIEAGGTVNDTSAFLGDLTGSNGTATVTGAGSTWTHSTHLRVGNSGTGALTIGSCPTEWCSWRGGHRCFPVGSGCRRPT
jgi:T5SS/PEP-CTERM-associated repeat protein